MQITDILQVLLGLVLVNYLMFDVVLVAAEPTAKHAQFNKALVIAGTIAATTTAAFLLTLAVGTVIEQWVLVRVMNKLISTCVFVAILAAVLHGIALVFARRKLPFVPAMGIFLPLILGNCIVMGITMPLGANGVEPGAVFAAGLIRCAGFGVLLMFFTMLRERIRGADIPAALRGAPATLLTAALLSMTFMGFAGLT